MDLIENRLLGGLSQPILAELARSSEVISLAAGHVLQQPQAPMEYAHFPIDCVLSVVASSGVGEGEIGMIGREGTTALPLVFESDLAPMKVVVQMSGESLRVEAGRFRELIDEHPELRSVLMRYAQCWATQIAQTSLANARNTVRERLSRWLMMCQDRTGRSELTITHEALATTLGVRRPGVTVATHELEGEGGIRARRGCIRILDRQKLTADARESYGAAEEEYERLLSASPAGRLARADGARSGVLQGTA